MKVRFYWFLMLYVSLITTSAALSILCSVGMIGLALLLILTFVAIGVPTVIVTILNIAIIRRSSAVTMADQNELFREDDVLLQGTALSQAALFFLVNLTLRDERATMFLGAVIVAFAVTFYSIRALAKVRNQPKLRYYSMYLFSLLTGNTLGIVMVVIRNQPLFVGPMPIFPDLYLIAVLPFLVYDVLVEFTRRILKKRYGYQ